MTAARRRDRACAAAARRRRRADARTRRHHADHLVRLAVERDRAADRSIGSAEAAASRTVGDSTTTFGPPGRSSASVYQRPSAAARQRRRPATPSSSGAQPDADRRRRSADGGVSDRRSRRTPDCARASRDISETTPGTSCTPAACRRRRPARPDSGYGSGASRTPLNMLKTAVVMPMPSAKARTANTVTARARTNVARQTGQSCHESRHEIPAWHAAVSPFEIRREALDDGVGNVGRSRPTETRRAITRDLAVRRSQSRRSRRHRSGSAVERAVTREIVERHRATRRCFRRVTASTASP